jgi:hypothetical protein
MLVYLDYSGCSFVCSSVKTKVCVQRYVIEAILKYLPTCKSLIGGQCSHDQSMKPDFKLIYCQ